MWRATVCLSALLCALPAPLPARDRIAFIDFYGAKGLDTSAVRRALPIREGDPYVPVQTKRAFHEVIIRVTGHTKAPKPYRTPNELPKWSETARLRAA
jgi:hypothetical protein